MERMSLPTDELATFLHLARASEMRRRPMVRDKLLVLAGVAAQRLELDEIADACRAKVLKQNPGHLLRRWPSMAEAHLWSRTNFAVICDGSNSIFPASGPSTCCDRWESTWRASGPFISAITNMQPPAAG